MTKKFNKEYFLIDKQLRPAKSPGVVVLMGFEAI